MLTDAPITVKSARRAEPIIPWITSPQAMPAPRESPSNSALPSLAASMIWSAAAQARVRSVLAGEHGYDLVPDKLVHVSAAVMDDAGLLLQKLIENPHDAFGFMGAGVGSEAPNVGEKQGLRNALGLLGALYRPDGAGGNVLGQLVPLPEPADHIVHLAAQTADLIVSPHIHHAAEIPLGHPGADPADSRDGIRDALSHDAAHHDRQYRGKRQEACAAGRYRELFGPDQGADVRLNVQHSPNRVVRSMAGSAFRKVDQRPIHPHEGLVALFKPKEHLLGRKGDRLGELDGVRRHGLSEGRHRARGKSISHNVAIDDGDGRVVGKGR